MIGVERLKVGVVDNDVVDSFLREGLHWPTPLVVPHVRYVGIVEWGERRGGVLAAVDNLVHGESSQQGGGAPQLKGVTLYPLLIWNAAVQWPSQSHGPDDPVVNHAGNTKSVKVRLPTE